jgi:diguanylate cyclase (GGDEF)-like protein
MEIRTYLQFLLRKWRIILGITLATLIGTLVLTLRTERVYETSATYILSVSPLTLDKDRISALNTLMSSPDISATYAKVASSRLIRERAVEKLKLSSQERSGMSVDSHIIAGTNILEITVRGSDPALIRDFANALGSQMVTYSANLYQSYVLDPLDEATQPRSPVKPNVVTNMLLGAIFGLALGVGIALVGEMAQPAVQAGSVFNILDDFTGLYNRRYFVLRLQEEMSRVKRNKRPLSLTLLEVDSDRALKDAALPARAQALRVVASTIQQYLRDEEVVAAYDETVLGLLLPDTSGSLAETRVEIMMKVIDSTAIELGTGNAVLLQGNAGIVTYQLGKNGKEMSPEELLERAHTAMQSAPPRAREKEKAPPRKTTIPQKA